MADIDFGGGGGTMKKLGKNKMFLIAAVGVGVIGLIVMMKKSSSSSSESVVTEGTADGYPNAYNSVDTVAQMQNMQSILAGQQDSNFNAFVTEYQHDISQVQTDIGEANKEYTDKKIEELNKRLEALGTVPTKPPTTTQPTAPTTTKPTTPTTTTPKYTTVTVKKGDTLSELTQKYGKGGKKYIYEETAKFNGIKNPNLIKPGQKIKILTK